MLTTTKIGKVVMNQVFTYQPAWVIGLSIIGVIIGVFFFGCIIAIVSVEYFIYFGA